MKFLLNLVPSEPLALVKEFACFDNLIYFYPLPESVLDMCFQDPMSLGMFNVAWVDIF